MFLRRRCRSYVLRPASLMQVFTQCLLEKDGNYFTVNYGIRKEQKFTTAHRAMLK